MMDEIENSSQPYPSLTPTSNKLSFGKRLNNDELRIGPASFSTNTPTKIRGIQKMILHQIQIHHLYQEEVEVVILVVDILT